MRYDHVVVGSGISGLTAALILSKRGAKVAIIERHSRTAPLIRRFKRGDVWCDPGLHYFGGFHASGSLSVLFSYLGLLDHVKALPLNPDGFDILSIRGQREISLPCGYDPLKDALSSHFPQSGRIAEKYIDTVRSINENTPFSNFHCSLNNLHNNPYQNIGLADFLKGIGTDREILEILGAYGYLLYGVEPEYAPLQIHALVCGSLYQSAHIFVRGGDELVNACEAQLKKQGVEVYCGTPVTHLRIGDRRQLVGVEMEGGEVLETASCICTIHPQLFLDLLPPKSIRPAYGSRIKNLENTFGPFVVFLDVEIVPEKISNSNYFYLDTGDRHRCIVFMVCNQYKDNTGKNSLVVLRQCDKPFSSGEVPDERVYGEFKDRETQVTLEETKRIFPELSGRYKVVEVATPYTLERYTGTVGGSTYGVKHSMKQSRLTPFTGIDGLYLAGQGITAPGIMGSMVSGFIATSYILGLESLWKEVCEHR